MAINFEPWNILGYILLGSFLGMVGQGIRIIMGLKKAHEEASTENQSIWFDSKQLVTSLVLAFIIGGVAGALGILPYVNAGNVLTDKDILMLIAIGYAGTDFIEGFINSSKLPSI